MAKLAKLSAQTYDVHPGVAMVQKWVRELPEKSGKTIEEWAELVLNKDLETSLQKRDWLKKTHGFGTNAAWWVVEYAEGQPTWDANPDTYLQSAENYVEDMYLTKPHLRPIYDALYDMARSLGDDIRICPCKTMVPVYRQRVIAEIKASTKSRVDLSLVLPKDQEEDGILQVNEQRLRKGDRLSHIIHFHKPSEVTTTVKKWFKVAYVWDLEA